MNRCFEFVFNTCSIGCFLLAFFAIVGSTKLRLGSTNNITNNGSDAQSQNDIILELSCRTLKDAFRAENRVFFAFSHNNNNNNSNNNNSNNSLHAIVHNYYDDNDDKDADDNDNKHRNKTHHFHAYIYTFALDTLRRAHTDTLSVNSPPISWTRSTQSIFGYSANISTNQTHHPNGHHFDPNFSLTSLISSSVDYLISVSVERHPKRRSFRLNRFNLHAESNRNETIILQSTAKRNPHIVETRWPRMIATIEPDTFYELILIRKSLHGTRNHSAVSSSLKQFDQALMKYHINTAVVEKDGAQHLRLQAAASPIRVCFDAFDQSVVYFSAHDCAEPQIRYLYRWPSRGFITHDQIYLVHDFGVMIFDRSIANESNFDKRYPVRHLTLDRWIRCDRAADTTHLFQTTSNQIEVKQDDEVKVKKPKTSYFNYRSKKFLLYLVALIGTAILGIAFAAYFCLVFRRKSSSLDIVTTLPPATTR